MRARVDREACVGHGRCIYFAPELFAADEIEGRAVLLAEEVPEAWQEAALKGAKSCPEQAIILTDESGMRIWPRARDASTST